MAGPDGDVGYWLSVPAHLDALDITVSFEPISERKCDPGANAAARTVWPLPEGAKLVVDHPYGVAETHPKGEFLRKYPEGDWMTSPQWFETVVAPFTSQSFVDIVEPDGTGMLIIHNGSQQWLKRVDQVQNIINLIDPWDGDNFVTSARAKYRVIAHQGLSKAKKWKLGREFFGLTENTDDRAISQPCEGDAESGPPPIFSALSCDAPNVVPTAFYREAEDFSGKHLDNYAGQGMEYPFVVRLVEFDGIETIATMKFAGTVAKAYKTNLLGQIEEDVTEALKVRMRPYEIATVYLDIVEGRKQTRDLDAKREVWATVHRVDG
jgi:alpha-mannosidase